jgi:F-type H+-transporting ATPase subunit delta
MAEKATIARPYARAAFAYARSANALAAWGDALNSISAIVANPQVKRLIGNPKITSAQLIEFVADVASVKLEPNVRNFLDELARNRRLALLPEVASMFDTMRNDVENVADVQITSAVALDDSQRARMTDALKKRLKKEIRLHCAIDASLIGGAVIRSGDLVIDGSLRARLAALSGAMTH